MTYIRTGFFYQSLLTFVVPGTITPEFRYPDFLSAPIPIYDVHDTGKVVCECFLHAELFSGGQIVPIVAEQLTITEICATIQAATKKVVKFVPLTHDAALHKLHPNILNIMQWYHDFGGMDQRHINKTKDIHPNIKTFAEWLREIAQMIGW